jgi:hypothetical protein
VLDISFTHLDWSLLLVVLVLRTVCGNTLVIKEFILVD